MKSYLRNRQFIVQHVEEITSSFTIKYGVPQNSVLRSVLYLLHTANLSTDKNNLANDIAILVSHKTTTKPGSSTTMATEIKYQGQ